MQRIQDNLQMMRTYFDALFGKNLNPILDIYSMKTSNG
jgi:hypothetical protein